MRKTITLQDAQRLLTDREFNSPDFSGEDQVTTVYDPNDDSALFTYSWTKAGGYRIEPVNGNIIQGLDELAP